MVNSASDKGTKNLDANQKNDFRKAYLFLTGEAVCVAVGLNVGICLAIASFAPLKTYDFGISSKANSYNCTL